MVGGGLAGLSVAYYLTERATPGTSYRIAVVEPGQVGALTSSASTGGYRTFYPNEPNLTQLAKRSITLLEQLARASKNGTTARTKYETIYVYKLLNGTPHGAGIGLQSLSCGGRATSSFLSGPSSWPTSSSRQRPPNGMVPVRASAPTGATKRTASPTRQCFYSLNSRAA